MWVAANVYRTVKEYFAHWDGLPEGYDFDARYRSYLIEALAAPDRRAFSLATMRLVASLENGHTSFTDLAFYHDETPLPFYAEPVEGRWTVRTSRMAEVKPGAVLVAVDGTPIEAWVDPIRAVIGQSSSRARDHQVFNQAFMFPRRYVVTLDDGRRVPVDRDKPLGPRLGPPVHDGVSVQHRADGTVVIAIPSFGEPRFEADAAAAVRAAGDARLILLDVRGNGGGDTPEALLKAIMTRPYAGTVVVTPLVVAENDAHGSFSPEDNPAPNASLRYGPDRREPDAAAYAGRMALLVDRRCASACEDFTIRFQSGRRGPVLGEATWGSTGQPIEVSFPAFDMRLRVSTKRESFADGRRFEGVGVQPDIPIPLTRADVTAGAAGEDPVLERAIRQALAGGGEPGGH